MSICRALNVALLAWRTTRQLAGWLLIANLVAANPIEQDTLSNNTVRAAAFSASQIQLHWQDEQQQPYKTIAALSTALNTKSTPPIAIMNAGIYDRQHRPLGLHIEQGVTLRPLNLSNGGGNFFLQPNGVFAITAEEHVMVMPSNAYPDFAARNIIRLATQSGPLLVNDNQIHPLFLVDSDSRKHRNGVGVRSDGMVVFAKTPQSMNLHNFAEHFRDTLQCPNALYLDGTISEFWHTETNQQAKQIRPFVGMLSVTHSPHN